jgi:hypothetical protein
MPQAIQSAGPSPDAALAAQGLTSADVEANRAGRVSPTQLERLGSVRKWGRAGVFIMLGGGSVASVVLALYHYLTHGDVVIFILPAVAVSFLGCIYLFVYRRNRLPSPSEIANAKVITMRARVGGSLVAYNRGVYNVWLNNVRYSGCANALSDDVCKKERMVDAYIVEGHKLVVALVPAD